jgi:hypothetical protein
MSDLAPGRIVVLAFATVADLALAPTLVFSVTVTLQGRTTPSCSGQKTTSAVDPLTTMLDGTVALTDRPGLVMVAG